MVNSKNKIQYPYVLDRPFPPTLQNKELFTTNAMSGFSLPSLYEGIAHPTICILKYTELKMRCMYMYVQHLKIFNLFT